jgi:hypothetical protein
MEIGKMLSSNKGIALIILIIVITFTSFLGIGIASFVSSRQKSLPLMAQSYQAYALANAGIEFATRYVYENWAGFSVNPGAYITISGSDSCSPDNGKAILDSSNNPLFYLCYDGSNELTSIGVVRWGGNVVAQRKIVLRNFPTYVSH